MVVVVAAVLRVVVVVVVRAGLVVPTFSWLNFSKSLSQLKEDSRRRCSDLRSDPARVEACGWAGILIPYTGFIRYSSLTHSLPLTPLLTVYTDKSELSY